MTTTNVIGVFVLGFVLGGLFVCGALWFLLDQTIREDDKRRSQ